jgi:hypothetical protein
VAPSMSIGERGRGSSYGSPEEPTRDPEHLYPRSRRTRRRAGASGAGGDRPSGSGLRDSVVGSAVSSCKRARTIANGRKRTSAQACTKCTKLTQSEYACLQARAGSASRRLWYTEGKAPSSGGPNGRKRTTIRRLEWEDASVCDRDATRRDPMRPLRCTKCTKRPLGGWQPHPARSLGHRD